ncbi:MAG: hypothetical protein J07HX64_02446 [halophilic archaeon J07HX64]|jgi:hypothetical protein|nr:MAG: hypothetical protein J07HX64_02446 [halophilic archaeon J07HX64]
MSRDRNTSDNRVSASHGTDEDTVTRQSGETSQDTNDATGQPEPADTATEQDKNESGRPEPAGTATEQDKNESGRQGKTAGGSERELRPAVTRHEPDEDEEAADVLRPTGPPEPQKIDPENAAFVLLGAGMIVGTLLAAILGF